MPYIPDGKYSTTATSLAPLERQLKAKNAELERTLKELRQNHAGFVMRMEEESETRYKALAGNYRTQTQKLQTITTEFRTLEDEKQVWILEKADFQSNATYANHAKIGDLYSKYDAVLRTLRADIASRDKELATKNMRLEQLESQTSTAKLNLSTQEHVNKQLSDELCEALDRNREFRRKIDDLEEKHAEMRYKLDELEPVAKSMAAVRKRQNIQFMRWVYNDQQTRTETILIRRGNEAAHGGNGLVDEALIANGYIPLHLYGQAFEAQYGCKPGNFAGLHQLLQDTLNCEATIRAVSATVASESYRRFARDLILNIKAEFEKVQTGCEPLIDLKQDVICLKQTKWRIIDVERYYRRRGLMTEPQDADTNAQDANLLGDFHVQKEDVREHAEEDEPPRYENIPDLDSQPEETLGA